MKRDLLSIVIATYNMGHLIQETIESCLTQKYQNIEIIVYDDCSTDNTQELFNKKKFKKTFYFRGEKNVGVGDAFNAGIKISKGEYVMLMCADDLITTPYYFEDVVNEFMKNSLIGYVTRYYYQYIDGKVSPVRAWHCNDPIVLANNPSGLSFRRFAIKNLRCSNKMFIETSKLASDVMREGWRYKILKYDAIAVRVHASTSTQAGYYLKRRVSSPVMDWYSIGGDAILKDYVSLIQIKCNYKTSAVVEEIINFIKLRPLNIINPLFLFYSIITLITPRLILREMPHIYRKYLGGLLTKEIKRNA